MEKKYLVIVPMLAKAEIFVSAINEEEAKEKAWLEADEKYINKETLEAIYFDESEEETLENIKEDIRYKVLDCKEEFGE